MAGEPDAAAGRVHQGRRDGERRPGYAEALVEDFRWLSQSLCVVLSSKMCVRLSASYIMTALK